VFVLDHPVSYSLHSVTVKYSITRYEARQSTRAEKKFDSHSLIARNTKRVYLGVLPRGELVVGRGRGRWSQCAKPHCGFVVERVLLKNITELQNRTRNSSGDEIANVNFLYDDIVHALQNTIDSCINSATDPRGYVLERRFTKFSEITQCDGHYAVQGHPRSPYLVPIESSCTFLLVIYTNVAAMLHRFRDIAFNRSKIAIFGYPSCV